MPDMSIESLAEMINDAIPNAAPFDLVLSALELSLSQRIKGAAGPNPIPPWADMAGVLVARHVVALCKHPGTIAR